MSFELGPVFLHHAADVLEAGMGQAESAGADDVLDAQQEGDVGVPHRDAVEVVVIRRHQIEEVVGTVSVEDHLAVTRGLDDDGLLGRAALGEVVRPVERRAVGRHGRIEPAIDESLILVDAGVDENRVSRLDSGGITLEWSDSSEPR